MLSAHYGDELDFSSVQSDRRRSLLEEIELTDAELNEIRELQREYQSLARGENTLPRDPDLIEALSNMDGDPDLRALRGKVRFSGEESELGWDGRE